MSYVANYINFKREDKKLYVSTQVLSALLSSPNIDYELKKELVDISVEYAELLLKKLEK